MEDCLITLETAQLAKTKGFNEFTKNHFRDTGEEFNEGLLSSHGTKNSEWLRHFCRPTQSLLQRWLREKHGTHIVVDHYKRGHYGARVADAGDNSIGFDVFVESYATYELALEAALLSALDLIDTH